MKYKSTLVLICALMCDERLFAKQKEALSDFFNVIVLVIKDTNNIKVAAEFVLNYIQEEEFYIAGISMGGYITMEVACCSPRRIKKICLMATKWNEESNEQKQIRKDRIKQALEAGKATATYSLLKTLIYETSNQKLIDLLISMNDNIGLHGFVNQQELILSNKGFEKRLPYCFDKQVLVISGEYDIITPKKMQKKIADNLLKSKLVCLQDCGHLIVLEKPKEISNLLYNMITESVILNG